MRRQHRVSYTHRTGEEKLYVVEWKCVSTQACDGLEMIDVIGSACVASLRGAILVPHGFLKQMCCEGTCFGNFLGNL
ncbi:hypothetical protein DPEC_G00078960 [Dallia pectoralis]|uniref:Uncharacterized protein n=1 Tax=Dallia pectoralis TaxID=75939 RepID=A0ACC2H4Y4_DALPE|nr:hypothetical protein DPEC_G00078960 [Dallia pectoralis]